MEWGSPTYACTSSAIYCFVVSSAYMFGRFLGGLEMYNLLLNNMELCNFPNNG